MASFTWTGKLGTDWDASTVVNGVQVTNWTPTGIPSSGDTAVFDSGTYTVTNGGDAAAMTLQNGTIVALSTGHFQLNGPGDAQGLNVLGGSRLIIAQGVALADFGTIDTIGGLAGAGSMEIESGAQGFESNRLVVGDGGEGDVTVNSALLFSVEQSAPGATDGVLTVGASAKGSIDITGSQFFSTTAFVGTGEGGVGEITLDASTWGGVSLTVGQGAAGTVTLKDGSSLALTTFLVGTGEGGSGEIILDASTWAGSSLTVGQGTTGTVTVKDSSSVTLKTLLVGSEGDGSNGTITVDASTFNFTNLTIGEGVDSNFNPVTHSGSGAVSILDGSNSTSDSITVDAKGGESGQLTIDASTVNSNRVTIGLYGTGTVNVANAATVYFNEFDIGLKGTGIVGVDTGGKLGAATGVLGVFAGSSGAVTVDNGSTLAIDNLTVGDAGDGSLDVTDSKFFTTKSAVIASGAGTIGEITVSNSSWSGTGTHVSVGPAGTGNLSITNGTTATLTTLVVGPKGTLSVSADGGITTSQLSVTDTLSSLVLTYGTINVTGGGEILVGATSGNRGAITVDGKYVFAGLGTVNADIDLTNGGTVKAEQPAGGTLTVNGNINGVGEIEPIMKLEVNGTIGGGVEIGFNPDVHTTGQLVLDVPRGDQGVIVGFDVGNSIDVKGLEFTQALFTPGATGQPGTLELSNGTDAPLDLLVEGNYGAHSFLATPGATDTMVTLVPCYRAGTEILTARGEVKVEQLMIGDKVATRSGQMRPIKWIGKRSYSGRFIMGRKDILPVCIKADALDDNVPRRDLWISPHHAMYLDGVLIEAKDLVNGLSIIQAEHVDQVEYFHIELDTHDVIYAEGAPSETFLDDGSRGMFHNAHEYAELYPEDVMRPARYCAPRLDAGYRVEAVREVIARRAGLVTSRSRFGGLRGFIDEVGQSFIRGWAQNTEHPEAPVCLDVFAEGKLIGQTLANKYREDLEQTGLGSGRHSFELQFPPGDAFDLRSLEVRRSLDGTKLEMSEACIKQTKRPRRFASKSAALSVWRRQAR
jgi:T5SS/PEP-CTERM-associated repeat protein